MLIYKIFRADEWALLQAEGETLGAPIDVTDGYVHFSNAEPGINGLMLLACEADAMGADLKWEPSRGGALFPHLYRKLTLSDVVSAAPLPLDDQGVHIFPQEITL